jgi:hypothetical protein
MTHKYAHGSSTTGTGTMAQRISLEATLSPDTETEIALSQETAPTSL